MFSLFQFVVDCQYIILTRQQFKMSRTKNNKMMGFDTILCCESKVIEDGQIMAHRKNIIQKSEGKNKKSQKTSLKKRTAVSNKGRTNKQEQEYESTKKKCIQQQKPMIFDIHIATPTSRSNQTHSTNIWNVLASNEVQYTNGIKQEHEIEQGTLFMKKHKVVNFTYSSNQEQLTKNEQAEGSRNHDQQKSNSNRNINIGITVQNKIQQNIVNIPHYSQMNQKFRNDPYKSTQATNIHTERLQTADDCPGLSLDFKVDGLTPNKLIGKMKGNHSGMSLGQRKKTVLSFNGESESQLSVILLDLEPPQIAKYSNFLHCGTTKGENAERTTHHL